MTAQQIQMGKTYRTRDGRKVELISIADGSSTYPVWARVQGTSTLEKPSCFTNYGRHSIYSESTMDLIEVKKVRTFANPDYKDPTLISMDKKYRTRDGRAVMLLMTTLKNAQYPVAGIVTLNDGQQTVMNFTDRGRRFSDGSETAIDLIEVTLFDDLKIDDPVVVTIGSQGSVGRVFHFAGTTEDRRPKVWAQGRTSLTVKNKVCDWWAPVGCKPYVAE